MDGIFDAPVTGVYVFTWTIAAKAQSWLVSELIVSGERKGLITSDNDANDLTPTTAIALVHLNAGQHVYVRRFRGGDCTVVSDEHTRAVFSGWLLLAE